MNSQVRMNPTMVQSVVTYDTIIEFANPELKLFPGMTAYVTIPDKLPRAPKAETAVVWRLHHELIAKVPSAVGGRTAGYFGKGRKGFEVFYLAVPARADHGRRC